jgi:hypothetical protein
MKSIFKMAVVNLSIRPSQPCIITIFKPTIFKFRILIEDCMRIKYTFEFFDSLSISSEIELGLGSSQIQFFLIIFHHFLRIFLVPLKFRVDPMMYGRSNHKKMADKIKMAAKHEFSITLSIFMQIN